MSDRRAEYRLVFNLPPAFALRAQPGRHQPCVHGCMARIEAGQVQILGPSRFMVMEQAARLLRLISTGQHEPEAIAAILHSPPEHDGGRGGRDGWQIIVNAKVAFSPTALPPDLFDDAGERVEPALVPIDKSKRLQLVR